MLNIFEQLNKADQIQVVEANSLMGNCNVDKEVIADGSGIIFDKWGYFH